MDQNLFENGILFVFIYHLLFSRLNTHVLTIFSREPMYWLVILNSCNGLFQEYVNNIEKTFDVKELSYFELNLETWRQLWRVIEMSDIILIIVDIRYAVSWFVYLSLFTCYIYCTIFVEKVLRKIQRQQNSNKIIVYLEFLFTSVT